MNICTNCKTENSITAKYCSICGFKLAEIEISNTTASLKKEEKRKPKFDFKTILGFIVGFVVMFFVAKTLFSPTFDKQLVNLANEMNKVCPMILDKHTTLQNVVASPDNTIVYNYVLTDLTKEEVKFDFIEKNVFPNLLENVKTNPEMKLFRDNKVILIYYYSDKNGKFVTEYRIKPNMYE
jgi:hypothetical protein